MFGVKVPKPVVAKSVDPNLLALENSLQERFGTQVKLLSKGQGGRIEISYHDQEELSRILDLLGT